MVCMYFSDFSKFGLLGLCKDCRNFLFVIEIASAPSNLKVRLALKSKVISIEYLSLFMPSVKISYRNFHLNEFVANALLDNIGSKKQPLTS